MHQKFGIFNLKEISTILQSPKLCVAGGGGGNLEYESVTISIDPLIYTSFLIDKSLV